MSILCYAFKMVKIFGLDIPPGFEDAWARFFQFTSNLSQTNFILKTAIPTRAKKASWNIRSLFVRWQSLYDGFDFARKVKWTNYWVTLPFSSHTGGGGWPGSGYSAFVYWNAPRFKAGLALDYDPPATNLIEDGTFQYGGAHWAEGDAGSIGFGSADIFNSGGSSNTLALLQNIPAILDGVTYRVTFQIFSYFDSGSPPTQVRIRVGQDGIATSSAELGYHSIEMTATIFDVGEGAFSFLQGSPGAGWTVKNVSMIAL